MTHLVCPSCGATNRVPGERLGEGPRCGRCRTALSGTAFPVDGAALARLIAKSDLPVLVDFWAPWCGPCRAMAPAFAKVAARLAGRAVLVKLDIDADPDAARRHQVQAVPTLVLFTAGQETARQAGALPESALTGWLEANVRR